MWIEFMLHAVSVLAVPVSILWISYSIGVFLYQLDYYIETVTMHRPQLVAWRSLATRISEEPERVLDATLSAELREDRYSSWAGMAAMTVSIENAASLVWVHTYLVSVGAAALLVAIHPDITWVAASIIFAGIGSIAITSRLLWLTRYSSLQYEIIQRAMGAFQKP